MGILTKKLNKTIKNTGIKDFKINTDVTLSKLRKRYC